MRTLAIRADDSGCGFYRMQEPSRVLNTQGHEVVNTIGGGIESWRDADKNHVIKIEELDYDVVVFQMPSKQDALDVIPLIQKQGIAVVAEWDDDYWSMSNGHYAKYLVSDSDTHYDLIRNMSVAASMADLVTVTTPALGKRLAKWTKREPVVIPNFIPESYLKVCRPYREELWVGYAGNAATHPGDLETTGREIVKVVRDNGAKFYSVGGELEATVLGFKDQETLCQDWVPLNLYPQALTQMDIGIVPLRSCAFNDAKSYLKGLEYASFGVPFVASSTPEYARLADKGVGVIANSKKDWYRHLDALLRSQYYRDEVSGFGYEWAKTQTYEANAYLWVEAWGQAVKNRKKDLTSTK